MKRVVIPIPLATVPDLEACEFDLELQEPGSIVQALVQVKEASLVQTVGKPKFNFIPTLLVLIDPEAPKRARHFWMIPPSKVIDVEDNDLEYVTTLLSPNGAVLFIFEEIKKVGGYSKWAPPDPTL